MCVDEHVMLLMNKEMLMGMRRCRFPNKYSVMRVDKQINFDGKKEQWCVMKTLCSLLSNVSTHDSL